MISAPRPTPTPIAAGRLRPAPRCLGHQKRCGGHRGSLGSTTERCRVGVGGSTRGAAMTGSVPAGGLGSARGRSAGAGSAVGLGRTAGPAPGTVAVRDGPGEGRGRSAGRGAAVADWTAAGGVSAADWAAARAPVAASGGAAAVVTRGGAADRAARPRVGLGSATPRGPRRSGGAGARPARPPGTGRSARRRTARRPPCRRVHAGRRIVRAVRGSSGSVIRPRAARLPCAGPGRRRRPRTGR